MTQSSSQSMLKETPLSKRFDLTLFYRLATYLKSSWKLGLLAFLLLILSTLLSFAAPLLIAMMVDIIFVEQLSPNSFQLLQFFGLDQILKPFFSSLHSGGKEEKILFLFWFAGSFLVAKVLLLLLDWLSAYLLAKVSQQSLLQLRGQVFSHILSQRAAFYQRQPIGRLITRVTNDVSALQDFFGEAFFTLLKGSFLIVGVASLLLLVHTNLALVVLSTLPFMLLISIIFRYYSRPAYRKERAVLSKLNAFIAETFKGIEVVKLFQRENQNNAYYEDLSSAYKKHLIAQRKAWAFYRPGYTVLQACAIGLVLWLGARWALQAELSPGVLTFFILLADTLFYPIREMIEKLDIIQAAISAAERIFGTLDRDESVAEDPSAYQIKHIKGDIAFKNVCFGYTPSKKIFEDLSFQLPAGKTLALVGSTGAGKSTILRLLCRFYDPSAGTITIDGHAIDKLSLQSLRSQVAVVQQDVFLFAGSIYENISLGNPAINRQRIRKVCQEVQIEEFIMNQPGGYDALLEEGGYPLSAGQRQLLSFARALAYDPPILALDEATSSIDPATEILIRKAMDKLMHNRTCIVIAHRLSTVEQADHIFVIEAGKIIEQGNHQELLAEKGQYARFYNEQKSQES